MVGGYRPADVLPVGKHCEKASPCQSHEKPGEQHKGPAQPVPPHCEKGALHEPMVAASDELIA